MDRQAIPALERTVAAALDWWREAGVDGDWRDEARDWLEAAPPSVRAPAPADSQAPQQPAPAAPAAEPVIAPATIPSDLAAFAAWWMADPALDSGRTSGRTPPRGPDGAEVMILVPEPEREDAGRLLAGPQGRLLDAMLAAMGIAPDAAYVASALPRHTPHADWPAAQRAGLGRVLARHVVLAAPKRLIVFGANVLPLLGHDPANSPAILREFNQEGANLPLLAARDLAAMLGRPRWKAEFWRNWLVWTGAMETGTA